MSKVLLLTLALFLHPSPGAHQSWYSMVVFWNIGQGQWVTAINPEQCLHYDFGGERSLLEKNKNLFLKLCKNKQNVLFLSHSDLDHYAFYSFLVRNVPKICWSEVEHSPIPHRQLTQKIQLCSETIILRALNHKRLYNPAQFFNKNDSSKIYAYKNVLLPGDSSQKLEKIWAKEIRNTDKYNYLLLGHHGSRTSTSNFLLSRLPKLKMAIVQSRQAKFKHPHVETLRRLKQYHLPVIRIEDWGTTAIQY